LTKVNPDQGEPIASPCLSEASYLGTLLLFELFYVKIRVPSTKYWLGTRRRRGAANLKKWLFALQPANKQAWRVLTKVFSDLKSGKVYKTPNKVV
jgi:hypothetical protein